MMGGAHSIRNPVGNRAARSRGFTLLEVMIAVTILGLALTAILSAQGGLAASNRGAQNMGVAGNLARCKMSELEEKLLRNGYPDIDETETEVSCCDGIDHEGFVCDYKVEKVELPQPPSAGGDAGIDLGALGGLAGGDAGGASSLGAISLDGGVAGVGSQIAGQLGGAGAAGMLDSVMAMVYPSLKGMMETSIRRLTVTVRWKEGPVARELPLIQLVTNPQRSGLLAGFDGGAPPLTPGASPGGGSSSGATPTPVPGPVPGRGGGF
jgi:general secretion pathway protein I